MFLAANRKDEGIYYTPAGITGPMADSLVESLAGPLVEEIRRNVSSQKCYFVRADASMAQLAEIRVADTNIWKEAVKPSPTDYNYRLLKTDVVKILPNLELNFLAADSLVDVELEKQSSWLAEYHQAELKKLSALRARYIEDPMNHAT